MKLTAFFAEDDSIIAKEVWRHFENIKMYVEPFFNFGSVLISRPGKKFKNEIVNDYDGHIANVWRSIKQNAVFSQFYKKSKISLYEFL